ncbi:deoxyribose-phosphate aldolase [Thermosulfurimonas dismutans]|uniref:Multifunctional fusion protein n=1 Tax=Thermosulfurimonas dismutans TaxID=999894 RepID=A0A179D368_9BACT|nr:deoxyribose-phosphate aldolase [Thermosulfurimonas dismutans]OAQ20507.1 Deoxyribose-phosphate aldolase [Thermosulfurimonas dismutans]
MPKLFNPAPYIDHTLLAPTATEKDIKKLCSEAQEYGMAGVCVPPVFVPLARKELSGTGIRVVTVAGFPLGFQPTEVKVHEARLYRDLGADEIDMVINLHLTKNGRVREAVEEVKQVVKAANPTEVKVIIECAYLKAEEKKLLAELIPGTGAAYLKTSTGFGPGGATLEDVKLLREASGGKIKIKAAGGIRTLEECLAFIQAGAERIGTSAGASIVREYLARTGQLPYEEVEIFIDGACLGNPGPGGFSAILRARGHEKVLTGGEAETTNNRMEIRAAVEALKALKKPSRVKMYTDSKYLLSGATDWLPRWEKRGFRTADGKPVKNRDLWEELSRLLKIHEVEWIWIEGHAGHPENERCDKLAKNEAKKWKNSSSA